MEKDRKLRARIVAVLAGSIAVIALAGTISIDASKLPYSQVAAAKGVGAFSEYELRTAALFGLWGMYGSRNGLASVPKGTIMQVKYADGTKEKALVSCTNMTACMTPIIGTQESASGGGGGGGGGYEGSGDGGGFGGDTCSVVPGTTTACSTVNGVSLCQTIDTGYIDCGFGH
ncbi:hypothetical protein [Stenotrophomonas maltophilia]|uniref:hypothetical protein n=1 Tax=Stenotrophomonas maltophilia TaxID=40324 RepID=UPI002402A2CB|nr:hypothetical protein [Stenotrophomonas maltophilia]